MNDVLVEDTRSLALAMDVHAPFPRLPYHATPGQPCLSVLHALSLTRPHGENKTPHSGEPAVQECLIPSVISRKMAVQCKN